MSDNWRPHQPKKLTHADMERIGARVSKQIAKKKEAEAKAAEKADAEAGKKKAEETQMSIFDR